MTHASITLFQLLALAIWIIALVPAEWRWPAIIIMIAIVVLAAMLWRRSQAAKRRALFGPQPLPGGDPRATKRR